VVIDDIDRYGTLAERGFLLLTVTEALLIRPDGSRIALNSLSTQAARTLEVRRRTTSVVASTPTRPWRAFPNLTQGRMQLQGKATPRTGPPLARVQPPGADRRDGLLARAGTFAVPRLGAFARWLLRAAGATAGPVALR
jgi:hypothetical protein